MRFSKMHGLGNDFMVVDAVTQNVSFSSDIVRQLSDRHCGIGFDQLLLVEPPYDPDVDFHYRIFNSDGNEVYQCGNGIRCFARFVHMKKLTNKSNICVSTQTRRMVLFIVDYNKICVDMGEPVFDPKSIPFCSKDIERFYLIQLSEHKILCGVVSIGNPHCVIVVENVETAPVGILGPVLENHYLFPDRVNISFMEIINRKYIRLRVYERGVGETRACGSAACASVAVGIRQCLLDNNVQVDLIGGNLFINWKGIGYPIYMIGSATHVYDGYISL